MIMLEKQRRKIIPHLQIHCMIFMENFKIDLFEKETWGVISLVSKIDSNRL